MNASAIYSKSGKGVQEAAGKTSHLSRPDRAVLSAIDGRATLAEVAQKVGKPFDPAFQKLYARNCDRFTVRVEGLRKLPSVAAVRVKGLFAGLDLRKPDANLYAKLLKEGLFTFVKGNLLVLAPPLNIETALLEKSMDTVERVLQAAP